MPFSLKKTLFFLGLYGLMTMNSCQSSGDENAGRAVFHYNETNNITSLDPAFTRNQSNIWAVHQLFNALVQLDDSLHVQPCLAKRWEISADGRVYTFVLRNDVFFHDDACFEGGEGRKMTAADVAYSFQRLIDPAVGSTGSWLLQDRISGAEAFRAVNDSTFEMQLQQPFRPMLSILAMAYFSVVPHEAVEFYGADFRANPVGTGAFRFKKWIENQALIFVKNEKYFEKDEKGQPLPYLDGVRVSFVNDRNTAYLNFRIKKLDFLSGLESSFVDELLKKDGSLRPKNEGEMQLLKSPFLNTEYLGILMNNNDPKHPLSNKKVRQALNYGFDRQKMLRELRNGIGRAATSGFVPAGLPSFDANAVKGYHYDPAKARTLLAEAGFPNGKNMPAIKLHTNSDYLDLCTFIARQWEDLGVKVELELLESATLREMMKKGQAQFFRASWIVDYPDAENFLTLFYSKNAAPPNYTRFANAQFDALYEAALLENDDRKRFAFYQEMDKLLIEEAPVIFLFYDEVARFTAKNVRGMTANAGNLLNLKSVYFEE